MVAMLSFEINKGIRKYLIRNFPICITFVHCKARIKFGDSSNQIKNIGIIVFYYDVRSHFHFTLYIS